MYRTIQTEVCNVQTAETTSFTRDQPKPSFGADDFETIQDERSCYQVDNETNTKAAAQTEAPNTETSWRK